MRTGKLWNSSNHERPAHGSSPQAAQAHAAAVLDRLQWQVAELGFSRPARGGECDHGGGAVPF
jgi:hypothetical protein